MFDAILRVTYIVANWGDFSLDDLLRALAAAATHSVFAGGGIGG